MGITQGYVMGIDVGTQSVKVGVYETSGKLVTMKQKGIQTQYLNDGYVEQDPYEWWSCIKECISEIGHEIDITDVKALSVCTTSSTVLLTDQQLNPLEKAIMWMDQRNVHEEEEINQHQSELVKDTLKYCGEKVSIEWMTVKSLWLQRNRDLSGKFIVEQLDWVNYQLTEKMVASKCNASCKWNYISQNKGFNHDFYVSIGLENILEHWPTEVLEVGSFIGELSESASKELGLSKDTRVYQGGIDAHIGMIGSGSADYHNLCLITGTSFVHLIHHDLPIFQKGLWGPYDSPLINDYWLLEGGQLSAGSIISWFLNEFYTGHANNSEIFEELEREVKDIPFGSNRLIMLDHWQGNRTPYRDPYVKGAIVGLTSSHTKYHIYRAVLESITFGTTNVIETIRKSNVPIKRIVAGGGLTQNKLLMQMISDCTNIPIYLSDEIETSAKGAAIIASFGEGNYDSIQKASTEMTNLTLAYSPKEENHKELQRLFNNYLELNNLLNPFMKTLA